MEHTCLVTGSCRITQRCVYHDFIERRGEAAFPVLVQQAQFNKSLCIVINVLVVASWLTNVPFLVHCRMRSIKTITVNFLAWLPAKNRFEISAKL